MNKDAFLIANHLSCGRNGQPLIKDLCLTLKGGDGACLTGPNGCGKTTILRTFADLLDPLSGTYSVSPYHFIKANPPFTPSLTADETIQLQALLYNHQPLKNYPDPFQINPLANKKIASLSVGQKQRLNLHTVLIDERPVWLLDEPTNALDREARNILFTLANNKIATGGIVLVATHTPEEWKNFQIINVTPS